MSGKNERPEGGSSCAVCAERRSGRVEIYEIREGEDLYLFNVDRATQIVADGRPAAPLLKETIEKLLAVNDYDPEHLPHVDPNRPGIVLMRFGSLVLVDGIHRAARCLAEGRSFQVQLLSYQESQACLVHGDASPLDAATIARKLRRVLESGPGPDLIEAEIECVPEVLDQVRALLTPKENRRLKLRAVAGPGFNPSR